MNRRVALVAGLLGASGAVMVGAGWSLESARSDESQPGPAGERTTPSFTPVLSARRVPDVLVRPQAARRLRSRIDPILESAPAQTCVVVADGAAEVYERKPDELMPAASNQKLLTAFAALDVFDVDTTFTTRVAAGAAPAGGTVEGDLWVIGGGDPVIDSDTYQSTMRYGRTPHTKVEDIADRIAAAGVTRITGSIRGDDSRYDDQRVVPTWPDRYLQQNQVGPLTALSVNDARTYPVVAGGAGGTPRPAADPPAYAASALTDLLRARGVDVVGAPGSGTAPTDLRTLVDVPSMPLRDIVGEMLRFSDNNTAELLLKEIGREASGTGSTESGLATMRSVLERAGLPMDGVELVDGSGLDIGNRVTCRLLSDTLGAAGTESPIAAGLAIADGPDGTLRDRFEGSPAAGAVRAKTGTLKTVTALSGWASTERGLDVRFAVVVNTGGRDVAASDLALQQKVAEAVLSYPDAVDPAIVGPGPCRDRSRDRSRERAVPDADVPARVGAVPHHAPSAACLRTRYRELTSDVLAGDGTFGVTLIERGSEVGGGDVRSEVGCLARILEAEEQPDGRWHIVAVGAERISVEEWLPDDPYPRAIVRRLPDTVDAGSATDDLRWLELDSAFRELLRLIERVTDSPVGADVALDENPATATFQMAALTPLGPLDRQQVLAAPSAEERRSLLLESFEHLTILVNGGDSN